MPLSGTVALHENKLKKCGAGGAAADRINGSHSEEYSWSRKTSCPHSIGQLAKYALTHLLTDSV